MRSVLVFVLASSGLLCLAGCANEPAAAKNDDRIGVRAGVAISSRDMSRVVPARPDVTP